jgi:hypothetical protein
MDGRKEGMKEGRTDGRKEEIKEGKKERRVRIFMCVRVDLQSSFLFLPRFCFFARGCLRVCAWVSKGSRSSGMNKMADIEVGSAGVAFVMVAYPVCLDILIHNVESGRMF